LTNAFKLIGEGEGDQAEQNEAGKFLTENCWEVKLAKMRNKGV
jgi:hypothetical protein